MPHDPHFKGEESFKGKYIHAHDFIDGKLYKGQRVLCIGGSYSAEDIALQVFSCRRVYNIELNSVLEIRCGICSHHPSQSNTIGISRLAKRSFRETNTNQH